MNFIRRPRRQAFSLQLTAMIDIFSMIVIFLVLGTTSGTSELVLPGMMSLPQSSSKQSAEAGSQLIITEDQVEFRALQIKFPMSFFENQLQNDRQIKALQAKLKAYAGTLMHAPSDESTPLNVVADSKLPYKKLYQVLAVFREAGFDSLSFITQPERKQGL